MNQSIKGQFQKIQQPVKTVNEIAERLKFVKSPRGAIAQPFHQHTLQSTDEPINTPNSTAQPTNQNLAEKLTNNRSQKKPYNHVWSLRANQKLTGYNTIQPINE